MKKTLISVAALSLVAIVLASLALTSNTTPTAQSAHVSGHPSEGHINVAPPVPTTTTTTVATVITRAPITTAVAPVPMPHPAQTTTTTTTVPVPVATTTPTTQTTTTAVVPSVTPTTAPPTNSISGAVSTSISGTTVAPDKTGCTATAPTTQCVLLTATVVIQGNVTSPGTDLAFIVYDDSNTMIGTFTTKYGHQNYCLIMWSNRGDFTVASSPDCSGGPIESSQTTFDYRYVATFAQDGHPTMSTEELS